MRGKLVSNRLVVLAVLAGLLNAGCDTTGSFIEWNDLWDNLWGNARQDTWLEGGSIAVDPRTERAFVLDDNWRRREGGGYSASRNLYVASPDWDEARILGVFREFTDLRIVFPPDSVLVMAEGLAGKDHLLRFDPETYELLQAKVFDARFQGARLSPSGRLLAVTDNSSPDAPLHLIDTRDLSDVIVPHGGKWLEAVWLHHRDVLVAAVFHEAGDTNPRVRLLAWSFEHLPPTSYAADPDGRVWQKVLFDVWVDQVGPDYPWFSYSSIGVAPDDGTVVVPVIDLDCRGRGECRQLLVLDVGIPRLRKVDFAQGPVGFSPDGTTIVTYRNRNSDYEGRAEVWLIDRETLDLDLFDLGYDIGPQFFITSEGNWVVIAPSPQSGGAIHLWDLDTGAKVKVDGQGINLREFVVREGHGELWLVADPRAGWFDSGADSQLTLFRLDLVEGAIERVWMPFGPDHLNILPERDLLVLDDLTWGPRRLGYLDPDTGAIVHYCSLPPAEVLRSERSLAGERVERSRALQVLTPWTTTDR